MLTEGVKVPNVSVMDDTGKAVNLQDFAGQTLVLWFYPKDDTPG